SRRTASAQTSSVPSKSRRTASAQTASRRARAADRGGRLNWTADVPTCRAGPKVLRLPNDEWSGAWHGGVREGGRAASHAGGPVTLARRDETLVRWRSPVRR